MFGGSKRKQVDESEIMEDPATKSNTSLIVSVIIAFLFVCLFVVFGLLAPILKFWPYVKCPKTPATPPSS